MLAAMILMRLLLATGIVTGALTAALVIYGNTLSTREDDELYLNKAEQTMMASEQQKLIHRMHRLARVIFGFALVTATLLAASAAIWVWIGLRG
jgi:hypothetical protein